MIEIRDSDTATIRECWNKYWHSEKIVSKGIIHTPESLNGFCAYIDNLLSGLITYKIINNEAEIITLNSFIQNKGIGTKLIYAVKETALENNCVRIWLITTNDNLDAIKYYQKRGFIKKAVYSIDESRKLKPEIPLTGFYNIEIKNELEFEYLLK